MSFWDAPAYLRDQLYQEEEDRRTRERWRNETPKQYLKGFSRHQRYRFKSPRQYNKDEFANYYSFYKDRLKRDRFHRTRYGVTPIKPVDMTKRLWKPPAWSSVHARKFYPMPRIKREVSRREPIGTRMVNSIKRNRLPRKRNTSTYYSPGYPEDGLALRRRFIEKSNKY